MPDFKIESVSDGEFRELLSPQSSDQKKLPAELRKRRLHSGRTFHPPIRRVPCLIVHAKDRNGQTITIPCPVLMANRISTDHYECVLLVAEVPRIMTTVARVPVSEIENPNILETEIEW